MTNNLQHLTLSILLFILFSSCTVNINTGSDGEIIRSDRIDSKTRTEIHELAKGIYEDVLQHDIRYTAGLFPPASKSYVDTLNSIISNIHIAGDPSILNTVGEFHIIDNGNRKINSVSSGIANHNFTYYFNPLSEETYVYLFYVPGKYDSTNVLISLEFSKEKKKWWLTHITFGMLTYKNQFAPQNVWIAYNQYLENKIIPAAFNIAITAQLLFPALNKFHYQKESEILGLIDDISKEYNEKFSFPLTVRPIDSKPEVYMLQSAGAIGSPQAMIVYKSKIFPEGDDALQQELNEIHLLRELLFPGILTYGDSITYKAISDTGSNASTKIAQLSNKDKHMTITQYNEKYLYPLLPDSIAQKMRQYDE